MPSYAQESPQGDKAGYTCIIDKSLSETANELNIFLAKYLIDLNTHNIQAIGDYYASNYISGDGFNKTELLDLLKQTWDKHPDLKYTTAVKSLRLNNNRANIEIIQEITATTKNKSEITKDKGCINGASYMTLYLEKYGSGWKIITDKTLYEEITIKYGTAKNVNISLDAPEQILNGEEYSASVKVDLPSEIFALGSITSTPVVYPIKQPQETFRQLLPDENSLERVIKSNKDNKNEIVSASLSFCEAERTNYTGIDLKVTGIAVISKRVNILPNK